MTDNAASQPLAPTARRIADALRHDILAGVLAPGTRIRQEDYSAHFGASRIPVREALKALQSEGLLTLQANRGAWVAHMNQAQCLEIYKIRERIEPLALSESTQRMPAAAMDGLEALVERMEQVTTVEAFIPLDREFHLRSYEYSSLPELNAMIVRYWNTTQQYRRAYMNEVGFSLRTIVDSEHRLLMDAIRRRDSYNAERLSQVHIRRTRLEFEKNEAAVAGQM
ncbi:GntR family transcriptional regulator [Acetobacter oeni]|uniref:GntR family transcriptional regulator n=1 Tax=Acetobacter oeni TaxID=304077 RepID=A0A511XQN8_9PROT|nr:GntR family transcriptional regulator [Acetobacter oeni]MBB3884851.1 DNA-binding GntR family transcriptional regulator [Acetobacter oeni]NHO20788.1 FCD domain-containing protein [Acetobacter oeni]GBR00192.1 GntR family transcriptional regulator [Acetobacter oeni LMG 21952]GEN65255.1 GntR family transcriptional regulator [Acetobacter oeni]